MPEQLIFTSTPRGLKAGSGGYCTVAQSKNLRDGLVLPLEQLSYYSHLTLPGQETSTKNPVICVYRKLTLTGKEYRILTRIVDAGADHTGRSNYLAHHLVFENDWRNVPSPAVIFKSWQGWHDTWPHPAGYIEEDPIDELKALNAGKAYFPEFFEYGWQHTFTSFLQAKDAQSQFDWVGVRNEPATCGDILKEANQPLIKLEGPVELQGDWLLAFKNPGRNGIEAPDNDENKLIDLYAHAQQQAICHAQDAAFAKANQKIDKSEKTLTYQFKLIEQVSQTISKTTHDFSTEYDHLTDEGGRKARLNQNTKGDLKGPLEKADIGYKKAEHLNGESLTKITDAKNRLEGQELIELDLSQELQQLKAYGNIINDQKSIIDKIISDFLSELEAMKPIKPVLASTSQLHAPQSSLQNQSIYIPRDNTMSQVANNLAWQKEEDFDYEPQAKGNKLSQYLILLIIFIVASVLIGVAFPKKNPNIIVFSDNFGGSKNKVLLIQHPAEKEEPTFYLITDKDNKYPEVLNGEKELIAYYKNKKTANLVGIKKSTEDDSSTGGYVTSYLVYHNKQSPDQKTAAEHWKNWNNGLLPFEKSRKEEIFNYLNCVRVQHVFDDIENALDNPKKEEDLSAQLEDLSAQLDKWDKLMKDDYMTLAAKNTSHRTKLLERIKPIIEKKALAAAKPLIELDYKESTTQIEAEKNEINFLALKETIINGFEKKFSLIKNNKLVQPVYDDFLDRLKKKIAKQEAALSDAKNAVAAAKAKLSKSFKAYFDKVANRFRQQNYPRLPITTYHQNLIAYLGSPKQSELKKEPIDGGGEILDYTFSYRKNYKNNKSFSDVHSEDINEYNAVVDQMKSEPLKDYKFIKATIKIKYSGTNNNWNYIISVEDIVPTKK